MTDRERLVEVMANHLKRTLSAKELLAALEADGWAWYPKNLVAHQWRHVDGITGDWQFEDDGPVGRCNGRTRGHEACGWVDVVPVGGEG